MCLIQTWTIKPSIASPTTSTPPAEDGSKDAGDDCRGEEREKEEKDIFYSLPESILSIIIIFFTLSFSNSNTFSDLFGLG